MDRNARKIRLVAPDISVALRKESVDRNQNTKPTKQAQCVALRKESVDRNTSFCSVSLFDLPSLSARRAWIEIIDYIIDYVNDASRSPQGERG